jgi:uncharacterized protein (TIGR02996 family)
MPAFKVMGDAEKLAKRCMYLAWEASRVLGSGVLQDHGPGMSEEQVWRQMYDRGDYSGNHGENKPGSVYADYVFGRMVKFSLKWDDGKIETGDGKWRLDYQSFCGRYPDFGKLVMAAAAELNMEVGPATGDELLASVNADPGDATVRLVYADWLEERGRDEEAKWYRAAAGKTVPNLRERQAFMRIHDSVTFDVVGPGPVHAWFFCYLHGKAEALNQLSIVDNGVCSPDCFVADQPIPSPGEHPVMVHGKLAWAVIAPLRGALDKGMLSGRIALADDPEGLAHARRPQDWR